MNEQKIQMVVLGTLVIVENMPLVTISFNVSQIPGSKQVKSMGITTDYHLNCRAHIDGLK